MENSSYRWLIVAACGLLGCVAIGGMFSLPVFLQPIAKETGWSVTGISSAMTIGFLAMACTSMIWGTLSDRFGPRLVVFTGSVVLAARLLDHGPRRVPHHPDVPAGAETGRRAGAGVMRRRHSRPATN